MSQQTRSPICAVMGHVDHGKSSLLDYVRNSNLVSREAGAITQAIGASIVPMKTIADLCSSCLKNFNPKQFTLPGLLFIDTPGHTAFTNLRKRGGNLADIAILVVDVNEGIMPQTKEAIQILKSYKTPFIIAANKIDLLQGYRSNPKVSVLANVQKDIQISSLVDTKIYELVGKLYEEGFEAERFDRVSDFTKQLAIVPISAKLGDGIPELLMVVSGLAQKFLETTLHFDQDAACKGTILEVKEEQGIGTALDVILYEGNLKVGDTVVVGTNDGPVVGKVRCLFQPQPHSDMMDKKSKYSPIKQAFAATGVKVSGPGLEVAVAGMPLRGVKDESGIEEAKSAVASEVEEVVIVSDEEGIVVKADSLGSLEALVGMLRAEGFKVRKATVGEVSRKDFADAESNYESKSLDSVILGFNLKSVESTKNVRIFTSNVIYTLIDDYKKWRENEHKRMELEKLADLNKPVKLEYLLNHTFRQSGPAIIGVEVLLGQLKAGTGIMSKDGKHIGVIKQIQKDNKAVTTADKKEQVAVSIDGPTAGRQINEGDIFYSEITESEFIKFKKVREFLDDHTKQVLKEIAEINRTANPVWGV